mmetsp:Transcript_72688/g.128785  ORF Transcript_72688/g.128785 Transcript_72688/m.128785 type:complete len:84 (+) Transcript_72688:177-428(+)
MLLILGPKTNCMRKNKKVQRRRQSAKFHVVHTEKTSIKEFFRATSLSRESQTCTRLRGEGFSTEVMLHCVEISNPNWQTGRPC